MYLAVLDDKGNEIPSLGRRVLFDVAFRMSPPEDPEDKYTIINLDTIKFDPLTVKQAWAAQLGVCDEADSAPFVIVPLEHGRHIKLGDTLAVAPGALKFSVFNLKPRGKQVPDPSPLDDSERSKFWEKAKKLVAKTRTSHGSR